MNDRDGEVPGANTRACQHCVFGLIVTGHGERDFLPSLFRRLTAKAGCHFQIVGRISQLNPRASQARTLTVTGTQKRIPTFDEERISIPTRKFLRNQRCHFVILVDDIEAARREAIAGVFQRYRTALERLLQPEEKLRAAVHFLSNMMEAYYFAHSAATNKALGQSILCDYNGDVEDIANPKAILKERFNGFDERKHGALIMNALDLEYVLNNPTTCSYLRALFGWCVERLTSNCPIWDEKITECFQLPTGKRADLTRNQEVT